MVQFYLENNAIKTLSCDLQLKIFHDLLVRDEWNISSYSHSKTA